VPVILGDGRPVFAGAERTNLKLLQTHQFADGNVWSCYQPIAD